MDDEKSGVHTEPGSHAEDRHDEIRAKRTIHHYRHKTRTMMVVITLLSLTTLFGAFQYARAIDMRRSLDAQYNRAFYELTGYVQNVETLLMKARLTSSPQMATKVLQEVWHQAELVATNLGQLPVTQGALSNTHKFVSQVGDYAHSLNLQSAKGVVLDAEDFKTLDGLHKFAVTLEDNLGDLQTDLQAGNLKWENLSGTKNTLFKKASAELPKTFDNVDQSFQEMPSLIYDGPFSEHMTNQKAKGLTGDKINGDQAAERIKAFLGKENVSNVKKLANNTNGVIDTYNYSFTLKGKNGSMSGECDVSVVGGKMVWFLASRNVGDIKIDINKAKQIGKAFLEKTGYKNMEDTYYTENNGIATINYAYRQGDITVYADLVKVKVALDNGDVVGLESKGYLMSHTERKIEKPAITPEQARSKVIRGTDVKPSGLAIIPTNFNTENLVYEFKGKLDDKDFIVYINAMTGAEEDILIIINTDEGILTL